MTLSAMHRTLQGAAELPLHTVKPAFFLQDPYSALPIYWVLTPHQAKCEYQQKQKLKNNYAQMIRRRGRQGFSGVKFWKTGSLLTPSRGNLFLQIPHTYLTIIPVDSINIIFPLCPFLSQGIQTVERRRRNNKNKFKVSAASQDRSHSCLRRCQKERRGQGYKYIMQDSRKIIWTPTELRNYGSFHLPRLDR